MSAAEAVRFLAVVESGAVLAERLGGLADDPAAVHAAVRAEGFDCTPDEIKTAFLDAHGATLSAEQLNAIAGGVDGAEWAAVIGGAVTGVGVIAAATAAFL